MQTRALQQLFLQGRIGGIVIRLCTITLVVICNLWTVSANAQWSGLISETTGTPAKGSYKSANAENATRNFGTNLTAKEIPCQNFPFPQNATYPFGIMPGNRNYMDAQESYVAWKNNYVTTSGACGFRRVLFNDMSSTYSEGIGYGMLLAVNYNDQALFDDLWSYYNANLDGNGLMHWWIGSDCQVLGATAATDADEDVAFALLLADKQWCSNGQINYLQSAITQINRIYQREVERSTYVLKPGDTWGGSSVTNPSYFAPAYYRAFKAVTNNAGWDLVIAKCYQILNNSANANTGLVPDWCQANGLPAQGRQYYYYYDATRTPWRIALDYIWFGNQQAKTFCDKITNFARGIGSVNIREGYNLDGSPLGSQHINVFVGPFGAGSMGTGPNYRAFCDSAYQDNVTTVPLTVSGNYYNRSLRTLTLFLQTGNFFNPLDSTVQAPPTAPVLINPPDRSIDHQLTLTFLWHSSLAASGYGLQVATDSLFSALVINDSLLTDTMRQVQDLQPLTWYYWRVNCTNTVGTSAWSAVWNFRTMIQRPEQVTLVAPINNAQLGIDTVRLVWRQSQPVVDRYWLEYATDSLFNNTFVDSAVADTAKNVRQLVHDISYWWRVKAKNPAGWGTFGEVRKFRVAFTRVDEFVGIPQEFSLRQNYPNPFNPSTIIRYGLPRNSLVNLTVYNALGQQIAQLVNEKQEAGYHQAVFSGDGLSTGYYFYRLQTHDFISTRKLLFLK